MPSQKIIFNFLSLHTHLLSHFLYVPLQSSDTVRSLSLPVSEAVLRAVLEFIYTDECPAVNGNSLHVCVCVCVCVCVYVHK